MSRVFTGVPVTAGVSIGLIWIALIIDIILFSFLTWYLDNVWPWQDGQPKPYNFPCKGDSDQPIQLSKFNHH
jgi:hypothetical protein